MASLIPDSELVDYGPEIRAAAGLFTYDSLTDADERQIAMSFARLATELLRRVRHDDACVLNGLRSLRDSQSQFTVALRHRRGANA